jgi:hypothetical protein
MLLGYLILQMLIPSPISQPKHKTFLYNPNPTNNINNKYNK